VVICEASIENFFCTQEDEEPLPNDELPEHLRQPPPMDFSKVNKHLKSLL
jgi:hypothetical protein